MPPCPSCAAPLDDEGICIACGALTRGVFRNLDLGTPQVAEAVRRGLDFYHLLGIAPEAELRLIARRYRQLRTLFPDDTSRLASEPARRLALLETAGRVLTEPRLRQTYDELRAQPPAAISMGVVRCRGCSAPLPEDVADCPYCGTPRPESVPLPTIADAQGAPAATEPIDYYALLGITPQHLLGSAPTLASGRSPWSSDSAADELAALRRRTPPTVEAIEQAALERQEQVLLMPNLSQEERQQRADAYEVARRILRHEKRRSIYDSLLLSFRQGKFDAGRLDTLHQLEEQAQIELAEEQGRPMALAQANSLLQQGLGYLQADLPQQATDALRQALRALPDSTEGHAGFVKAALAVGDPIDLGGHGLREILWSLEALARLKTPIPSSAALTAFCQGLLARDSGDTTLAEAELRRAATLYPDFGAAWRALAAIALSREALAEALGYAQRAIALNSRDERAFFLALAACLRARKSQQSHELAERIAALRGPATTAADIFHELGVDFP